MSRARTSRNGTNSRLWEHWLGERLERWRRLSTLATGRRRDQNLTEARAVLSGYGEVARDVALARRTAPDSLTRRALEALYGDLHRAIHETPSRGLRDLAAYFIHDVPQAARNLRPEIATVAALFLVSILAGALLLSAFPDTAGVFLSPQMIETVQRGQLWTDDILNVVPSSVLSINLMTNNIAVALTCLALGVIYGLGTLYIICLNGMMLGGVFAYTNRFGVADDLYRFVIAHGLVELSVICLAGAAGLSLGRAIARPGAHGRIAAVRGSVREAGALTAVAVPFLIGSGIIEGYVSPDPEFTTAARTVIGVSWFGVLLLALDGRVWRVFRRPEVARTR
ncbi:MAG: stage II sporulation protein M [Gammaproteobacteria bacterium]|jgi:uncharacterized membrane protein SpoIIM required for sporulation